ncbi:MAG TPA: hypothetical protein VMF06_19965 [Candidatus Limnocylindria bacterium]|jgi:hypothetical protein|nr:hypothetical protein [Candidatus Limnocylindria bacterium]
MNPCFLANVRVQSGVALRLPPQSMTLREAFDGAGDPSAEESDGEYRGVGAPDPQSGICPLAHGLAEVLRPTRGKDPDWGGSRGWVRLPEGESASGGMTE